MDVFGFSPSSSFCPHSHSVLGPPCLSLLFHCSLTFHSLFCRYEFDCGGPPSQKQLRRRFVRTLECCRALNFFQGTQSLSGHFKFFQGTQISSERSNLMAQSEGCKRMNIKLSTRFKYATKDAIADWGCTLH